MNVKKSVIEELRDSLRHEHSCGTMYEEEEHDPFDNKNAGRRNDGADWQGNPCDVCKLLIHIDELIALAGGKGLLHKASKKKEYL